MQVPMDEIVDEDHFEEGTSTHQSDSSSHRLWLFGFQLKFEKKTSPL